MKISIIVPCHIDNNIVRECLEKIVEQKNDHELIIACDNLDRYASCSLLWFLEFLGIIVDISQCKIPAISELKEASLKIFLSFE